MGVLAAVSLLAGAMILIAVIYAHWPKRRPKLLLQQQENEQYNGEQEGLMSLNELAGHTSNCNE